MSQLRILIIDDNPAFRSMVSNHLKKSYQAVFEAEDGKSGLDLFLKEKPDAVLVDLNMPGMDGLSVLAELTDCSSEIPFIVISGADRIEDAVMAVRRGAWDFVIKGDSVLTELDQAMHKSLERAAFLKAQRQRLDWETKGRERVEETLRNKLSFIQTVIDAVPNQIFYKDVDGLYLGSNQAFLDFSGMKKEDLVNKRLKDLTPDDCDPLFSENDHDLLIRGGSREFEFSSRLGGRQHDLLVRKAVFKNLDGEPEGIVGVVTDITRQKAAEQKLRRSEKRFRSLLEVSPLPIIIVDVKNGKIVFVNKSGADHLGIDPAEVIGLSSADFYVDKTIRRRFLCQILRDGYLNDAEVEMVRRDGTRFWTQTSAVLMDVDDSRVIFASFSDVTARKDLEESLRKFEFMANASQDLMTLINQDFIYEAANLAYLEMLDKPEKDIVGHHVADIWGKQAFKNDILPHLEECLTGHTVSYKEWFSFPNRENLYYDVLMYPYISQEGHVTHLATVSRDITESTLAQTRILESREHFRAIFESSIDPIILFDANENITDLNTAAIAKFGLRKSKVVGRNAEQLHLSHEDFIEFRKMTNPELAGKGSWIGECTFADSKGKPIPTETSISIIQPRPDGRSGGFVAVMRDVSQRIESEQALRKSEQQYRVMFEATGTATLIINSNS